MYHENQPALYTGLPKFFFLFITDLFTEVHTRNTNTPQGNSLLTRKITTKRPRLK